MNQFFGSILITTHYWTFDNVLYQNILTIVLSIIRLQKIPGFLYVKFFKAYEKLDYKLRLIKANFMFKR